MTKKKLNKINRLKRKKLWLEASMEVTMKEMQQKIDKVDKKLFKLLVK